MTDFLKSASIIWSAFLFSIISLSNPLKAQTIDGAYQSTRDTLVASFKQIQEHRWSVDDVKQANDKIEYALENFLKQKDAFEFQFQLDKNISDMISEDKKIRVITWALPMQQGYARSKGYVIIKNPKTKSTTVYKLTEEEEKQENAEKKSFGMAHWPGAVYYSMLTKKYKKKTYYTLLGWTGADGITNKKYIDVLTVSAKGEPIFGAPVFQMKKQKWHRIIFEYSTDVVMYLNYEEQKKMIVFDHLAPNDPMNTGRFQYYGPDFSVDGLKWKKGMWQLEEDLDAKNKD